MAVRRVMTRAAVATSYGSPEVLQVQELAPAVAGAGQLVVEVRAAGVNPVDAKIRAGLFGPDPSLLPRRLGLEAAGVVTSVGPPPEGSDASWPPFSVGDEVIAFRADGAYATEVVVTPDALTPKPASLPWDEAAGLLLAGVTAVHALEATGVSEGDTVLVHGASGGVGQLVVQLARLRGARVLGTAGAARHDLLRDLGAEPLEYGDGLLERVRAAAPDGVDVSLDLVGTDEALDVSLAVADRSRVATIAAAPRGLREGVRVLGGAPGADPGTEIRAAARAELARLAGDGSLRVLVSATYPLDDVVAAHRQIDSGHTVGKIVLVP
jgi:NADPH2:quinone reductase